MKKRKTLFWLVLILVLILILIIFILIFYYNSTNNSPTGLIIKEKSSPINIEASDKEIKLFFCPRDNCTTALNDALKSADDEIYCAFFDFDLPEIRDTLLKKGKDIDVRLVIDSDNAGFMKGDAIRYDNRSPYMHNKFCIIDRKVVTTGSMNPTKSCSYRNNNNLIIIPSEKLAENYRNEFMELWNGTFGKGETTKSPEVIFNGISMKSYFCPEDKCSEKIQDEIRKAKNSIYFMTFSFTDKYIADDLIAQKINGLDIKGVFEKSQESQYSQKSFLEDHYVDVKFDHNKAYMHHKVFIIDNETVITGSFNPSYNADHLNDENILIIKDKDIASRYLEEFAIVYG